MREGTTLNKGFPLISRARISSEYPAFCAPRAPGFFILTDTERSSERRGAVRVRRTVGGGKRDRERRRLYGGISVVVTHDSCFKMGDSIFKVSIAFQYPWKGDI